LNRLERLPTGIAVADESKQALRHNGGELGGLFLGALDERNPPRIRDAPEEWLVETMRCA
jgi:hypothetical protein